MASFRSPADFFKYRGHLASKGYGSELGDVYQHHVTPLTVEQSALNILHSMHGAITEEGHGMAAHQAGDIHKPLKL